MAEVNFKTNEDDIQCAILGSLGLSTYAISRRTGLSPCQVLYRLHKRGIVRADYRNGESKIVNMILHTDVEKRLRDSVM